MQEDPCFPESTRYWQAPESLLPPIKKMCQNTVKKYNRRRYQQSPEESQKSTSSTSITLLHATL